MVFFIRISGSSGIEAFPLVLDGDFDWGDELSVGGGVPFLGGEVALVGAGVSVSVKTSWALGEGLDGGSEGGAETC